MSRINDLNTIRESGLYGGSNDFISARLGIFICIFYDHKVYKREKNMLMLTSSPALSTQGSVDQISHKVSLLMEGIVNQASLLTQKEDNAPKTDRVYGFLFHFIIIFFNLAPFWRDVATWNIRYWSYKTIFKRFEPLTAGCLWEEYFALWIKVVYQKLRSTLKMESLLASHSKRNSLQYRLKQLSAFGCCPYYKMSVIEGCRVL